MHKSLTSVGSLDLTRSSRGAVGKLSSASSLESTAGGGKLLKFSHLQSAQCNGDFTDLCFGVDREVDIIGFWQSVGLKEVSAADGTE